jgi:hypothetical protein
MAQLVKLGREAYDLGMAPVEFVLRDERRFSGPLTYVCANYARLGNLGFPIEDILRARIL